MTRTELQNLTVRQLREICRDRQLSGYSAIVKQGKQALINWMCDRIGDEPQAFGRWLDREAVLAEAAVPVASQIDRMRSLLSQHCQSCWHLLRAWLIGYFRIAIA